MPHEKYQRCLHACIACTIACEHCASECLHEKDVQKMARCIELDRDCADICALAVRLMARGSDFAARDQHGRNLEEIAWLVDAGLPLEEALLCATVRGAELLGLGPAHGRIAAGCVFDAVIFDREPSAGMFQIGRAHV